MDYHPGLYSFVILLMEEKIWNRLYCKGIRDTFYYQGVYVQITSVITPHSQGIYVLMILWKNIGVISYT